MNNNFWSNLTYPKKIVLSAIIFLAAAFALIYWLIMPTQADVENVKNQIENQQLQAEKDYAQGENLKKLSDNIKAVEPRVGEIEQVFIDKNDFLPFITSLEDAAAKDNVTEKPNLNIDSETALGSYYSQIPLALEVKGNFYNLLTFMSDLETMSKRVNINSLEISPINLDFSINNGTGSPQQILDAQIGAITYWEK
jgi:Tfp pilus assembly protein PilO